MADFQEAERPDDELLEGPVDEQAEGIENFGDDGAAPEDVDVETGPKKPLPEDVHPLLHKKYLDLEKKHMYSIKFTQKEKKYLSQYLFYLDGKKRVNLTDRNIRVAEIVSQCMEMIKTKLQEHTEYKVGELIECGSYFERTKVGDPHEFDFMYLMPFHNYMAELAEMTRIKSKESNLNSRTFFRLYDTQGGSKVEIVAKDRHSAFQATLEDILKTLFGSTEKIMTKKAGPAVKFVLEIPYKKGDINKTNDEMRRVKVDLTLALNADPRNTFFGEVQLRSFANYLRSKDQLQCQFIAAHDYWKLSFTKTEKELMTRLGALNIRGVCYRAIKILRDEVDVQDTLGDGILGSYPIKVTHLKETLHTYLQGKDTDEETWTKENIGENVIRIVQAVDVDGQKQQLKGIFIQHDNIMGESDKSYLESRRILLRLRSISDSYTRYALVNTVLWWIMVVAGLCLMALEIATTVETDWYGLRNTCFNETIDASPPFPLNLKFLFGFTILVWVIFLTNLAGLISVWVVTRKWTAYIYRVLPNLRIVYPITTLAALILVVFDIFLLSDYVIEESCSRLGNENIMNAVTGVSLLITLVPVILLVISLINNLCYYGRSCRQACSAADVMFFEFPFCRAWQERMEKEGVEGFDVDQLKRLESLLKTRTRFEILDTFGPQESTDDAE